VARSTSGDRSRNSTDGAVRRQQDSTSPAWGTRDDDQPRADRDQTLADADHTASDTGQTLADADLTASDTDQTLSDVDQTSSDSDQASADSDQASADCDQLAADRDQAASDQDLASGGDADVHDDSQDVRARSSVQRDRSTTRREQSAQARLDAAAKRDEVAHARDRAALARDHAADARNLATARHDGVHEHDAEAVGTAAQIVVRAVAQRKRAAEQRARAADQRALAARDRQGAAEDREQAAAERRHALADREALVVELQREQKGRDEALRHQQRAEKLARTLQRSLSPPSLPRVAGLDVAVHYEPSAPEDVGGDFYDLFPLAAGRSGFFLGDVCGKGPEAAAVTSLARYTMRTAAMLHEEPDAILMDLNAALRMQSADPQTCTAVYGEIDMSTGAAAITLAVAGHPAPLIVRAHGDIEVTPAHGTMLGAFAEPAFATCELDLGPGDAIVMCSDGILDTEIDGIRVDEERLVELLSGAPQASAQGLVDRLMQALGAIDRPLRDDVAIMALRRTPAG
jgi:sigma-B regulation protein RsbU (phosphoserine phosphatase)